MNKIENNYKRHAVRVLSKNIEGSGCIFQPPNVDYAYVLTAKHCLIDNNCDDLEISQVTLQNEEYKIEVIKEIFLHKNLDIAVIQINRIEKLSTSSAIYPTKDSEVSIYGFPHKLKNKQEPRENVQCVIAFRHDRYFELTSDYPQFTYDTAVPENIIGLSGSGVYIERDDNLSFVGIFTSLKSSDGEYNKFCAFNHIAFDELLASNGLCTLNAKFKMSVDFNLLNKVFYLPYTTESELYYLKRSIDDAFNYCLSSLKHIWISGLSGVGKTNLVFRNLQIYNKKIHFFDLSTLNNREIEEYFLYINNELVELYGMQKKSTKSNVIENLTENIIEISKGKQELILFVDEVPISNKEKFYSFLTNFIIVSERVFNQANQTPNIKWIISTRINPMDHHLQNDDDCLINKMKAQKNFHFKNITPWDTEDASRLLNLLKGALGLYFIREIDREIILASKGYPGKLKDVLERMIIEKCSIEEAIQFIKSEH